MEYWEEKIREKVADVDGEIAHGSIYSLLREMNVGDRLLVPYNMGKSVRPTASNINKEFGAQFKVETLYTVHGLKYVLARRIK